VEQVSRISFKSNTFQFYDFQVGRPISSANCPVVTLRQNRTALAQPKKTSLEADQLFSEDEAVLLLQKTSLTDKNSNQQEALFEECLSEVKTKGHEEENSILCREWIGDQDTSDYSSQSSLEEEEVFPFGLTIEEKALLKLEKEPPLVIVQKVVLGSGDSSPAGGTGSHRRNLLQTTGSSGEM